MFYVAGYVRRVMGDDEQRELTLEALRSAATRLRIKISQRVVIRRMPKLSFILDDQLERGTDIGRLIDEVIASDSRRHTDRDRILTELALNPRSTADI